MADWDAPGKYEGTSKLPASPAAAQAPPAQEEPSTTFDRVTSAIEALYEREGKLTRDLLQALRAASVADLERLFGP